MRKLLLVRGIPGSGKSTYIREHGLEPYTLSADTLRMVYAGPVLDATGRMRIPADNDRDVWQKLYELLEQRMRNGELIIVDATHAHPRSFTNYTELVNRYRYQVVLVDFATVPFETCMQRNENREEYKIVPPLEMKRMYENLQRTTIPKWVKPVAPEELFDTLQVQPHDASKYKAVHHIGDIQGCFTPLAEYFELHGIHDDQLYIFVGDYLDRGPQNAQVMQWLLENYQRPNFIFIEGNHEAHLRAWTHGGNVRSRQFTGATQIELEEANFSPKKVHGFLYKLRDMYYYTHHGRIVLVSHGGLSTLPRDLTFISSRQFIKGVGAYEEADISDASFAATAPADTYQVHGHRNRYSTPTQVKERCFNLEGKVEFGGELRVVVLDEHGFEDRSVKSAIDASKTILEPAGDLPGEIEDVATLLLNLRSSKGILEKPQEGTNISSFSFTRDVFYQKAWDELNVHARGLFINTATNVIVARSYEKFFNLGERPETQPDVLERTLAFPVRAWVKENGYLGLVGYNPETNELVFASKTSLTSDFAAWLKAQFNALAPVGSKTRQEITLYLKTDGGKTLVFEVIEPANDPHIIAYDESRLVLLDIVKNTTRFEHYGEKERAKIAKLLGCTIKHQAAVLKDFAGLRSWIDAVQHYEYTYRDNYIEGFVLEDARGFMVKIKLPWYALWRQMRTQLERLQSGKKSQFPAYEINPEIAADFLNFLATKSRDELKSTDIIALREEFESSSK
jgi:predicted kinase